MDLFKVISNPVRMQIMQYLQIHGEATTKQISQALTDIPAPTLYRHINYMLGADVLLVKEERKVRGSLERLLTVNPEMFREADEGNVTELAYQFLMEIFCRFQKYSQKKDADPVKDFLALRTRVISLTDEDMMAFFEELGMLLDRYEEKGKKTHGKIRSISLISAPYDEDS